MSSTHRSSKIEKGAAIRKRNLTEVAQTQPANDPVFFGRLLELPEGTAEECVQRDFLSLQIHMKNCADQNNIFFKLSTATQEVGNFLKTKIICSVCLVLLTALLVSAAT